MKRLTRCAALLQISLFVILGSHAVSAQTDGDNNGFRDEYEQALAEMFCPSLVLHSLEEDVWGVATTPEPVEIMTGSLWRELHYPSTGGYEGEQDISDLLSGNYSWIDNSLTYTAGSTQ
jgi:hypothetical protein